MGGPSQCILARLLLLLQKGNYRSHVVSANQRCQGRKEGSYEARIGIHKMKVAGWLAEIAPGGLYHIRIKHSKCLLGSKENTYQY